ANLKKRVNKLERKKKSRTPGMNLFKISTSRRRSLGEEDASKQGRNLKQTTIIEDSDFDEEFDANMDKAFKQVYKANKDVEGDVKQVISAATDEVPTDMEVTTAGVSVSTAEPVTIASAPVTTAGVSVTTAEPSTPLTTTITVFEDEDLTIAQTLVKMKSDKSKEKGLFMKEPSETSTRPTVPIQQLDPKDKDYELAARLQEQEQEELTIEEKSRLFVELIDKRKKHFARLRAESARE
ncbi:hypothetical protein Tco_1395489, partial [Tanacetum coccineum]